MREKRVTDLITWYPRQGKGVSSCPEAVAGRDHMPGVLHLPDRDAVADHHGGILAALSQLASEVSNAARWCGW